MTLPQYLARVDPAKTDFSALSKSIIKKLFTFLLEHEHLNIKFNFNPHSVIVVNTQDLLLQPGLLLETDQDSLEENSVLSYRWNIILD